MNLRASVALRDPDMSLPWIDFPRTRIKRGQTLYRAAKRGKGAWWFCHCGDCRFDLPAPRGTCYVGTDELSGLLETIGPDWCDGEPPIMLIPKLVRERVVHSYEVPMSLGAANLTSQRAVQFRITNELSDMTPYDMPQKYAKVFDQTPGKRTPHQFNAIRFRTRFDTGAMSRGVAIFDDEGERPWPSSDVREIDDELIAALRSVGVFIADPPGVT
jgi:hypothetical protein